MVFGTFDLLHPGHVSMLKEAKRLGNFLIVVIARDKTVLEVKGKRPKNNETVRLSNLQKLSIADKVVLGSLGNKFALISQEKPNIIALGYDQKSLVENLAQKVGESVQIVRLTAFKPEIYKSSKLTTALV